MRILKIIKIIRCSIKGHKLKVVQCPVTRFKSKRCEECSISHSPNHKKMSFS